MEFTGGPPPSRAWLLFLLLPALAGPFGAYVLVAPTTLGYHVDAQRIVVDADLGMIDQGRTIDRASVQSAEPVRLHGGRRTNGTGMDGYCQGSWTFDDIGPTWIATDCRAEAVLLRTTDGAVVISPPDRDGFLAAVNGGGTIDAVVPAQPRPAWMFAFAGLIALLPLLLLPLLGRIFRPLRYRVESGELVVPRHFGELHVRLAGVRVRAGDLLGAVRLAGSGMPGFHLGAYRNREGGFHAAGTNRSVGLFVDGTRRVYVTPDDRLGFVEALQEQGAVVDAALLRP